MKYNLKIQRFENQYQITHYTYNLRRKNLENSKQSSIPDKQYSFLTPFGDQIDFKNSEVNCNIANKYIFIGVDTNKKIIDKLAKEHRKIEKYYKNLDKSKEEIKKNMQDSLRRTKQTIYKYARANNWEWFATITVADINTRYDYDKCISLISKWLQNQKTKNCPDLKYIIVPEQHKDGAYHFHGVFSNIGKMKIVKAINPNNNKLLIDNKGRQIFNVTSYRSGFTTFTPVTSTERVSTYITKYITKDIINNVSCRKRYLCSKNLSKGDVKYLQVKDFKDIADTLDTEIGYIPDIKDAKTIKNPSIPDGYINILQADRNKEVEQW